MRLNTLLLAAALLVTLAGILMLADDYADASAVGITWHAGSSRLAP